MSDRRKYVLIGLAALTLLFISAAAYAIIEGGFADRGEHTIEPLPLGEVPAALRITVTEPGFVAIDSGQLDEIFLPIETISPAALELTKDGEQVPFYVDGQGEDATLYFFAQTITDTLEAPAVYWLQPGRGLEMLERNAAPSDRGLDKGILSRRWENNEVFLAQSTGEDVWLGDLLFAPSSIDYDLGVIKSGGASGMLEVSIWSNNQAKDDPDHHVILSVNGSPLAEHYWDGIRQETVTIELPPGLLKEDENTLTIAAPGDTGAAGEALYIDWIELKYQGDLQIEDGSLVFESNEGNLVVSGADSSTLLFDISNADIPVALVDGEIQGSDISFAGTGEKGTYLVLNQEGLIEPKIDVVPQRNPLSTPGRGADYVAVVADAEGFNEALRPLLDYRKGQGLQVDAVPAVQIYDEFGYGRATPEAIRDFIQYSAEYWDPAPRFVLLVGDASYDLNDFTQGKNRNLLPTHLLYSEHAGYVASDTWYTLIEDGSLAPAVAIGRFPAQTAEQLSTMVAKTIDYENAVDGNWVNRVLLIADDEPDFDVASDELASEMEDKGFATQKLYMTQDENIHDAIVSAWNQGVGVINYVGHGSVEVWGDERVFQAEDAGILINGDRLPIFTTFTCLNGYFNHPDVDALAETLLWTDEGGVAAAIAPSGRSLTDQQLPLADVFYESLLTGKAQTLGEALQMAKIAASDQEYLRDVIHTFNLLGDPALHFQLPAGGTSTTSS
jgi:hypothetical protein